MSVENAKKLLEKIKSDDGFRKQLADAPDDAARKKIAQSHGMDCTRAEFESILPGGENQEISEAELEAVAGGGVAGSITKVAVSVAITVAAAG